MSLYIGRNFYLHQHGILPVGVTGVTLRVTLETLSVTPLLQARPAMGNGGNGRKKIMRDLCVSEKYFFPCIYREYFF